MSDHKHCRLCRWPLIGEAYDKDPDRDTCLSVRHCKRRAAENAENDRQVKALAKATQRAARERPLDDCEKRVDCPKCSAKRGAKCFGEIRGKSLAIIRPHVERIRLGGYERRVSTVFDVLREHAVFDGADAEDVHRLARDVVDAISPLRSTP